MKNLILAAGLAAMLMTTACHKCEEPPIREPERCDEKVIYRDQHPCGGYILETTGGEFVHAIESSSGDLEKIFAGHLPGEAMAVGITRPSYEYFVCDIYLEKTPVSREVRLTCASFGDGSGVVSK
ncbi:MAG: hypothetical protein M3Q97_01415 [Bacteroidota bacterium]|nr:hypothetical protein [Bacteroidota bacterium]